MTFVLSPVGCLGAGYEESEGIEYEFITSDGPVSNKEIEKQRERRLKRALKTADDNFELLQKMKAKGRAAARAPSNSSTEEANARESLFKREDQWDRQSHERVKEGLGNVKRVTRMNPTDAEKDAAHEMFKDRIRESYRQIAEFAARACGGNAFTAADFSGPLNEALDQFDRAYDSSKRMTKAARNSDTQMRAYIESAEVAIKESLKGVDIVEEPERAERLATQAMQDHFQRNFKNLPGMSENIGEMERLGIDPDKALNFGTPADVGDIGTWGAADSGGRGADPTKTFAYDLHDEKIDVLGASDRGYRVRGEKKDVVARGHSGVYAGPKEMIADQKKWIDSLRNEGNVDAADEMEDVMRGRAGRSAAEIVVYERNGAKAPALLSDMVKATEEALGEKIEPTEEEIARVKFTPHAASGASPPAPTTRSVHPFEERASAWGVPFIPEDMAREYGYLP